jgi:hypothetical protein
MLIGHRQSHVAMLLLLEQLKQAHRISPETC